jgi:hypothetical protein
MVSRASTKHEGNGKGRDWPAATMDDLVRDGIYARFIAGCFRDRIGVCDYLKLFIEAGKEVTGGASSKRSIESRLIARLASLPPDIDPSTQSLTRACEGLLRLLGIRVFLVTDFGKTRCSFTAEGRTLWEEAVRWNKLGLLENHDLVDFSLILRLARDRRDEQNGDGDADIQREAG